MKRVNWRSYVRGAVDEVCNEPATFVPGPMRRAVLRGIRGRLQAGEGGIPLRRCLVWETHSVRAELFAQLRVHLNWLALAVSQLVDVLACEHEVQWHRALHQRWDPQRESSSDFARRLVHEELAPAKFRQACSRFDIPLDGDAPLGSEHAAFELEWDRTPPLTRQLLQQAVTEPVSRLRFTFADRLQRPLLNSERSERLRSDHAVRTLTRYARLLE